MRVLRRQRALALGAVLLVLSLSACDWSMFRGNPAGTGVTADSAVSVANAPTLAPAWSVPVTVPPGASSTLVESGGVLILGNQAYDASTGQWKWTSALIDRLNVAIADGLVYGTGTTGPQESPEVRALEAGTGRLRWRQTLAAPNGPPVVADGLLFQPVSLSRGGGTAVTVVDAKTGAHRFAVGGSVGQVSPPTIANGVVYTVGLNSTGFRLFAVDTATGTPKWNVDAAPCSAQPLTVPVVANGKVYSSGRTFNAETGAFLWSWPVCQTGATLAVTSTTVYVPYTTQAFGLLLGAFDANTGAMRWSIPWSTVDPSEGDPQPSAPVVANGVLFGVAPNGQGSPDNHIIADDARTGSRLWDSPRNLMNKYGDPIVANGLIYAASTNGHLDAFGPCGN